MTQQIGISNNKMRAFFNRLGIGARLLIWFLLVSLLPLLIAGTWAVRQAANSLEAGVTANLNSTLDAKVRQVDSYFAQARQNVETLSHNPSVITAMQQYELAFRKSGVKSDEYKMLDQVIGPFLQYYQTYYEEEERFYDLFLISPQGDIVYTVKRESDFGTNLLTGEYRDTELAKAFRTAAKAHATEISDFRQYDSSQEAAGFIATPIFDNGRLIGVVALRISTREIKLLASDYAGLGSSGETGFVSREGDKAIFVVPLRHDPDAAFERDVSFGSKDGLPCQKALQGQSGAGISTDYRGREVLAAWCYLPEVRWGLVVKQDADEAFASARGLRNSFLVFAAVTTLMVAFIALLISRSISQPIGRLMNSVDRIAGGNFQERVQIASTDEIGQLGSEFNRMAEHLETNITELSEQESRMRTILDSTADGILTIAADGIVTSYNAAAARLFGYRSDQIVGRNVAMIVPALAWKPDTENGLPLPNNGEFRELGGESETDGHHQDGHIVPLALRVAEMNFRGEKSFIATLQDITERKSNEQERERLFAGIREAVAALAQASTRIVEGASQMTASAQQQAALVTETTSTVMEVTHGAAEALELAKDVAGSARRADQVTESGRVAVGETVAAMDQLRQYTGTTAESILALAERAQTIGIITGLVDEFSQQTNVLALNAAVEASRAGEHGRGFAVVATEVKSLANQSQSATQRIRQILDEVREATKQTVTSTQDGTYSLDRAAEVLMSANETINKLADTISAGAIAAVKIVASFTQQANAMSQISESMTMIDRESRQALEANRQAEQLARDLNELGKRLTGLIEQRT